MSSNPHCAVVTGGHFQTCTILGTLKKIAYVFFPKKEMIISSIEQFGDGFGIGTLKTKQLEKNIGFQ